MNDIDNIKFEGILKGIDLELLDPDKLLEILINENIYFLDDSSQHPPIEFFTPTQLELETECINFEGQFNFRGKNYNINPAIIEEVYSKLEFFVKTIYTDVITDALSLDVSLMGFIETTEKIDFLKSKYKEAFEYLNSLDYLIYTGKGHNGFNNWKDYVCDYIWWDDFYIKQHLTYGITDYFAGNDEYCIIRSWINFHEKSNISIYCLSKFKELNPEKNTTPLNSPPNTFQALLLDYLVKIENWEELSDSKKGEILQLLTGKGKDNARKAFGELNKDSKRHLTTINKIEEKLKSLGCLFKQ